MAKTTIKPKAIKTTAVPITKARINLGAYVKRAHLNKERFVIEKDGYPVVAMIDIDEFEDYLDSQDENLKAEIRASRAEYEAGKFKPLQTLITEMKKYK